MRGLRCAARRTLVPAELSIVVGGGWCWWLVRRSGVADMMANTRLTRQLPRCSQFITLQLRTGFGLTLVSRTQVGRGSLTRDSWVSTLIGLVYVVNRGRRFKAVQHKRINGVGGEVHVWVIQ